MARAKGWMYLPKIAQLLILIVVAGIVVAGFFIPYVGGTGLLAVKATDKFNNTVCPLNVTDIDPPQQTTTLYASDGKTPIASFFNEDRVVIPFTQMPTKVIQALVDTEDRRFYSHHGVDIKGLARAALHTSNGDTQGASTLTEQYVKQVNYYNAISKGDTAAANAAIEQTAARKISDAKCALQVEDHYSKDEILAKYLNIAYFGESAYGIQEAAQTYFNENASQLTIAQGAMIVGLVRAPSSLDPYNYPQAARDRRNVVLANMVTQKDLTPAQEAVAVASPIRLNRQSQPPRGCAYANTAIVNVGFFCDYAAQWLTSQGGLTADEINTGGLKIVSTLQVSLQNRGQAALNQMGDKTLDPNNPYLLAMPSIQPKHGWVTSMITDKKYGVGKANDPNAASYTTNPIFTRAYAGSGSTYKYFTTIAALQAGVDPSFTLYAPSPYIMHVCSDPGNQAYKPENAGGDAFTLPLSRALPVSSNTYFVGMEDQLFGCNLAPIVNTATSLGMNYLLGKGSSGNSIAQEIINGASTTFTLGEEPTSALELTGAYATLANGGVYCPPTPIMSITDLNGKAVPFKQAPCTRQYSPYVANELVNIMTHDTTPNGGGTAGGYFYNWYNQGGSLIAGKTGTDNSSVCDANGTNCYDNGSNSGLWFTGVTPNLTAVAALINPDNPNKEISNVPGVTANNTGRDTFGAYASVYWQAAYGPTLAQQPWTWPTVSQTLGGPVPVVTGLDPTSASTQLTTAGFKVNVLANETCGSKVTAGNVAYYSPKIAQPGDVINMCLSSGVPPVAPPAPKPTTPVVPPATTATPGTTPAAGAPPAGAPAAGTPAPATTP